MSTEQLDKPEVKTAEETQEQLQQVAEQPDNPRARIEREIAEARAKERAAETGNPIEEAAKPEGAAPAEAPAEDAAPAETPPAEVVEAAKPAFDPDAEVELIIDGKPLKVKGSQIIETGRKALQKEIAADQRLEFASRLLDEATKRVQGQPPATTADAQPKDAPVKEVQGKSDAELAKQLQYGTEEQAAEAIREIRRRDQGAVSEEGLQDLIAKHLPAAVSSQLAFHEAVRNAQSEYKDIFADPYLTQLFHIEEHKARQAGDARPHSELYATIGNSIREHFKLQKPAEGGPTLTEKVAAKKASTPTPRLASVRLEQAPEPKAPTREEILAKMQRQRGQGKLNPYSNR